MLVLSRRRGQAIRIGPDIVVSVTRIRGGQVGLAIRRAAASAHRPRRITGFR